LSPNHILIDVAYWHKTANPGCRLNVRSCGKTGSDMLVLSLTAHDRHIATRYEAAPSFAAMLFLIGVIIWRGSMPKGLRGGSVDVPEHSSSGPGILSALRLTLWL
jgi:hypothetical protein